MVTCNICFEATQEVGEIDSCYHRFCWTCINQWADRDSRCPLCKQRFLCIRRKALQTRNSFREPPSKRHKPNSQSSEIADSPSTPLQQGDVGTAADASEAAAAIAAAFGGPSAEPGSPKGELHGVVLETRKVRKKDQVYIPEDDAEDLQELVENLHCLVCGADDNDEFLLICDGCDSGYHTYCVNRRTVPLGDWFCPSCMEQQSLQEDRHQQHRAQRQQRRLQQHPQQRPTEQAANTAPAAAAAVGRRRLQRGGGAAGHVGDDGLDLTLEDSDLDVSDNTAAAMWPYRHRAASTRGRQALGDSDSDYDLQDDSDLAAADYSDADDLQDSDWGGDEVRASQGHRCVQGPRITHHATGTSRGAAGTAAVGVSPSAARLGGMRQAASYSSGRGAHTGTDGTTQRRARSAGHATAMGAADASSTSVLARDGRRLKIWQELRAEAGAAAEASGARSVAGPSSLDSRGQPAAASVRTSIQIADLMKAVNQERRSRQTQGAASGATRGSSSSLDPEDQAWAALDTVRSAGHESSSSRGGSWSAASAAHTGSVRAAPAATSGGRQGVASSYFSSGQRQQRQSPHAGQGSISADSTQQQQQQAQLRQALAARLQQQKQLKLEQRLARGHSHQHLADSDPRDPGYLDIIRDSVAAARDKGEEDRRRRALADMTAAAKLLPAATVPPGTVGGRGAMAARRIASTQAGFARPAVADGAAAKQPVSRLAMRLSAAQQKELGQQQQRHRPRQREVGRPDSSCNFMGRWLSRGASSRDAGRPAAAGIGSGQNERADLPRSVRTLGSVKRGAAAQAAAAAAAPYHDGFRSGNGAAACSGQQQQQVSRQPLELRPSQQQQQQHVPQRRRHPVTQAELEVHAVKPDPHEQPYGSSRYFAGHSQTTEDPLQQQHCSRLRHQLVQPHHRCRSFEGRQMPGYQIPAIDVVGAGEPQHAGMAALLLQQSHHGPIGDGLQQQQQMGHSLYHLAPCSMSGLPQSQSPATGATQWQQHGVVHQHLLHNLQPGHSTTSNSSGTTCLGGVDCTAGPQGGVTMVGTPCSAGVLPLPVIQQQMADMDVLGSSSSAVVLPGQVLQPMPDHLFAAHQQQQPQPVVCCVQADLGSTHQISQIPSAARYTREQLKFAKDASADIVKAKLRPLLRARKITEDLYSYAARTASRGLYDQVKQGAIQYDAVEAAAAVAGGSGTCSKGSAEVMKVVDGMLQLAGVICSDAA